MDKLKTTSARSSFYGAARYVENDVRNTTASRNELKYGYYSSSPTYPGDWVIDVERDTLEFAFRASFNRRTTQMKGAYPEYHNDVNMEVAVVPLDKIGDFKAQLSALGVKITPHVESIIEHCNGYKSGEIRPDELGLSAADRERKAEQRQAAAEKAIHDATNLQAPLTVGGTLKLKR